MVWSSAPELGTGRAGDFRSLEVTAQVSAESILNDSLPTQRNGLFGDLILLFPSQRVSPLLEGVNWGGEEEFPADPRVTEEASPI